MLKSPKTKTLADGLIDRTSSMLDEIKSKTVHKDKESQTVHKDKAVAFAWAVFIIWSCVFSIIKYETSKVCFRYLK